MECSEIIDLLSDYLERDLPPNTCAVLEHHLAECPECTQAAEGLRKTVSLCREYRSENFPAPLAPEKQKALREAFEKVLANLREGNLT